MARRTITIHGDEDDMVVHVHKVLEMVYTQHRDEFLAHAAEAGWTLDQEAAVAVVGTLLEAFGGGDGEGRLRRPLRG